MQKVYLIKLSTAWLQQMKEQVQYHYSHAFSSGANITALPITREQITFPVRGNDSRFDGMMLQKTLLMTVLMMHDASYDASHGAYDALHTKSNPLLLGLCSTISCQCCYPQPFLTAFASPHSQPLANNLDFTWTSSIAAVIRGHKIN